MKPLVKWIGGKTKLAPKILERMPSKIEGTYFEPFVGGGAVFCALYNAGRIAGHVVLNDNSPHMMKLLDVVRSNPLSLIEELRTYERRYADAPTLESASNLYLAERDAWNDGHQAPARFVFLKQTSFNGLWRENKSGEMNAAWGKYGWRAESGIKHDQSPNILDEENILAWHGALQRCTLWRQDALLWKMPKPEAGDVVYLDPPYLDTFDGYTAGGFSFADHAKLLSLVNEFRARGVHVVYSNSVGAEGLIAVSWPTGKIERVATSYTVNVDGEGRGREDELLVSEAPVAVSGKKARRGVPA